MKTENEAQPKVSVLVTTYFRNEYLKKCLESVEAQEYPHIETIVIDDSGKQHAHRVCEEFDVQYIGLEANQGQNAARNNAFKTADGEYTQFLDDDDQLSPKKIEKQVRFLERHNKYEVVYCGRRMESGFEEHPDSDLSGDTLEGILAFDNAPCVTSTLLIDTEVLEDIMPLPEYEASSDLPLKIELARRTKFGIIDELLVLAGEPSRSMGTNPLNIEYRWQTLDDYSDLYDSMPSHVKRFAIADTYQKSGRRRIEGEIWSVGAIADFARALYYKPERSVRDVAELIISLGGRPTYQLASHASNRLRAKN